VRLLEPSVVSVRFTGTITGAKLHDLLGEGRDGFQVILLPHLSDR
jgi:hypothetical protein